MSKINKTTLEKTLNQLENIVPTSIIPEETSALIARATELANIPLKEFTPEKLRLMITQDMGLDYLIPLAIEVLSDNPFISGDYYEGDLLNAVVSVKREFWRNNPELRQEVEEIVFEAELIIETFKQTIVPNVEKFRENK